MTVTFWAKADKPMTINVSIDQTHEPWHVLGGRAPVSLTTQWKQYNVVLPINETDDKARLVFDRVTASRLGITPSAIDQALYDAYGQRQISTIFTQLNQYRVVLEVKPEFQQKPMPLRMGFCF